MTTDCGLTDSRMSASDTYLPVQTNIESENISI